MESLWKQTTRLTARPALEGDLEAEVAVIGGGLAGLLTAFLLRERGVRAVVLEAARIGSGQTENTTAKVTAQHGLIYDKLIRQAGEEAARQYARSNQQAVDAYRSLILERGIDCEWEERPAYLYTQLDAQSLKAEAAAAQRLGLSAEFTDRTELPFPVKGAVCMEGQAQFHPLKFLEAIAQELEIYENTRILNAEGSRLMTERGTVRCGRVVFTCHYPFVNVPGYYFMRMHQARSYVVALEGAGELNGMYLGTDPGGLSFRSSNGLLLLGGGEHRTGENRSGGKYRLLRQAAERLWPESREVLHWSAQDCIPLDGIPYIGRFSASTPDWYVATGFQKWGMSTAMVAARRLTVLLTQGEDRSSEVFTPARLPLPAGAGNLLEDGKQAVKGLVRAVAAPPRSELETLPPGHGGVMDCGGEKVGAYRDEDGTLHMVSIRCPHLGCQLEWNPDEKSWDCPCHGSRFDYTGKCLDEPAQSDLSDRTERDPP